MIFYFCKVQLYIVKSVLSNDKREEYAPYSGSLDYEDTVTVYDEVSTVTSQYRKHVVIYTLETGVELEPITFYEVRSWV